MRPEIQSPAVGAVSPPTIKKESPRTVGIFLNSAAAANCFNWHHSSQLAPAYPAQLCVEITSRGTHHSELESQYIMTNASLGLLFTMISHPYQVV